MVKLFSKIRKMSDGMKITLWTCVCFGFIGLMVLVIVFFVLTPSIIAKIALPLSSVLCALLTVPVVLAFEQILKITSKRDLSKQFSQYKKIAEMSEAVSEKEREINSLKVSLENYKKALDDARIQLSNQMVTPLEIQNITVEDRHILCTVPITLEKFYEADIDKSDIEFYENSDSDFFSLFKNFSSEDISYKNFIVMEHRAFPQISVSYKNIFVENKDEKTLCVYGVIPEVVSKSTERAEEHIVKFNEMIKTYTRHGKLHGKIVYGDAVFEKRKTYNKEKFINEFNERLSNGIELKAMENIFTAMAQEHIRHFLLSRVPNKQIKFMSKYYDEIENNGNAIPFVEFMHSEQKQLLIGN